jgi:prepilin-type N-terminal cleavage/methylation domain-containing protein
MQTAFCIRTPWRLRENAGPRPQRPLAQLQDSGVQNPDNTRQNHTAQRRHAQAGGSLIEVVVAVAIIAVMAAGLIGSLAYGFLATQLARENQRATQILLEKAEVIRLYNWDQYNYTNDFVPRTFTAVYDPQAPTNSQGLTYYGTLTLTDFPPGPSYSTNLRQITITLNWTTAGRVPHSRMLTTQIARDGLQNYVY